MQFSEIVNSGRPLEQLVRLALTDLPPRLVPAVSLDCLSSGE
jgi:hypothetical protein